MQELVVIVSLHGLGSDAFVLLQQAPYGVTQGSIQASLPIKRVHLTLGTLHIEEGKKELREWGNEAR